MTKRLRGGFLKDLLGIAIVLAGTAMFAIMMLQWAGRQGTFDSLAGVGSHVLAFSHDSNGELPATWEALDRRCAAHGRTLNIRRSRLEEKLILSSDAAGWRVLARDPADKRYADFFQDYVLRHVERKYPATPGKVENSPPIQ